jgi:hypothetical protein
MPRHVAQRMKRDRRLMVLVELMKGMGDEEIYRRIVGVAIQAGRYEGCDESDIEVIAAQARRDVAEVLDEKLEPDQVKRLIQQAIESGLLKVREKP